MAEAFRTALVTGGARRIGKAIVEDLAVHGFAVAIHCRAGLAEAERLAADIVGAVTGEARIAGEQIGRIEVRDTFTVVEVDSSVAERVIRALNGTTMRGRSLRVDFDRKTAAPPRRGRPARPG